MFMQFRSCIGIREKKKKTRNQGNCPLMFAVRNNTTHKALDLIACTPNSVDPASRVVKGRALLKSITSPEKYRVTDVSWGSFQQRWCHWMNANELWRRNIAGGLQTAGCLCDPLTVIQQRAHWCYFAVNYIGYSFIKDSVFIVWGDYRYKRENLMNDWGKMKEHNIFVNVQQLSSGCGCRL